MVKANSPESGPVKVPDSVKPEEAAFHFLASKVMNSVRLAHLSMGEATVAMGVGPLGQFATIFSTLCGSLPVIAFDPSKMQLGKARISGATELIDRAMGVILDFTV